jgi:hypothetical protein
MSCHPYVRESTLVRLREITDSLGDVESEVLLISG